MRVMLRADKRKMANSSMRIGIDLGGTKIEALAIDRAGRELVRHRIDTPREDYDATVAAMAELVRRIERETGATGTVGAGIPGCVSSVTGLVKNANSTWLNGRPLDLDLCAALKREVRMANDANCLARLRGHRRRGCGKASCLRRDSGNGMRRRRCHQWTCS